MNKRIIQVFIILVVILFCVSLISESNDRLEAQKIINSFEENVSNESEVENGTMIEVNVVSEDSSNFISNINAKIASFIVEGLNGVLNLGLKLIGGLAN